MLPYIDIFGKEVYTYPLIVIVAFAIAVAAASFRARSSGLVRQDAFNCGLLSCVGAVAGGKIMFLLTMLPKIIETPSMIVAYLLSGFTYYGAFIGALAALTIYLKAYRLPLLRYFDLIAASVPIAQAVGRLGCYCAGCCYGCETTSALGVVFSDPRCIAPLGVSLVPTQLIEAGACLLLFAVLLIYASRKPLSGRVFSAYLIGYGVLRFIIEFFRADDRGPVLGLSVSQYISLAAVVIGSALFIAAKRIAERQSNRK